MSETMQAWGIKAFGGPEVIEPMTLPRPDPGPGEILIAVQASSVNPVDYKIRRGDIPFLAPTLPTVLHPDSAGTVAALGDGVAGFAPGDRVYAFAGGLAGKQGALADYIVADARLAAPMPPSLDFAAAAALPLVGVTAWNALIDQAAVGPQHSVLIQGGTGGVGHVALQLAKARGATVFATVGDDAKAQTARALGADGVFNYKTDAPKAMATQAPGGAGFDIVFNTPGAPAADASVKAARFRGQILDILGEFPSGGPFQTRWLTFTSVFAGRPIVFDVGQEGVGRILREITALVEAGRLRPLLDPQRFTFAEAAAAHRHAEFGAPTGKVVLSRRAA